MATWLFYLSGVVGLVPEPDGTSGSGTTPSTSWGVAERGLRVIIAKLCFATPKKRKKQPTKNLQKFYNLFT